MAGQFGGLVKLGSGRCHAASFVAHFGVGEHLRGHGIIAGGMKMGEDASVGAQDGSVAHHAHVGLEFGGLAG